MNTKKIFLISALALLVCGCQDDEMTSGQPTAAPGEEVQFGGTLDAGALTRTIYGTEDEEGFPIYWVDGDQVLVASPECANNGGVGTATYAVTVEGKQQNYATSMDKTGDIGVRWGDNVTGTFYSVYPAASHTAFNNDLTSARLTVTTQQNNTWNPNDNTVAPDMSACFMYAKTEDAPAGKTVNLAYKPISTAVRIPLMGPNTGDEPVTIQWIRLYAPDGTQLSGQFDVDFTQIDADGMPKVTAVKNASSFNYASMNAATTTGSYLTLGPGETATVQLFFMLEQDMQIDANWSVRIATSDGMRFTKNLGEAKGQTLKRGQIHKLPMMPPLSVNANWDPSNWMVNIQRNVYLSEISIPGSWNSLNDEYQNGATIADQYAAGVRAFHLDTRWRATDDWYGFLGGSPITDLGIANGGSTYTVHGDNDENGNCMTQAAPTFESALKQITDEVKEDEYMVVYCTFAQGSTVYGDWRTEIARICQENGDVIDAHTLTAESTVQDVLGKVIVIVSTYTKGEVASKTFFTNLRNELAKKDNIEEEIAGFTTHDYFTEPLTYNNTTNSGIQLYATYAQITAEGYGTTGVDDLDGRGYAPTLNERQTKCENLLNWSQNNYATAVGSGSFEHNAWIFMGLGGYVYEDKLICHSDNRDAVNNQLIPWLNNRLTTMETNGAYYPVGIVFMNHTVNRSEKTTVDITQTVEDILLLNNRYRKAYDPERSPVDGSDISGGSSAVNSVAPGYSSGMTDNGTNAIGW